MVYFFSFSTGNCEPAATSGSTVRRTSGRKTPSSADPAAHVSHRAHGATSWVSLHFPARKYYRKHQHCPLLATSCTSSFRAHTSCPRTQRELHPQLQLHRLHGVSPQVGLSRRRQRARPWAYVLKQLSINAYRLSIHSLACLWFIYSLLC